MPLASTFALQWFGPACAAMRVFDTLGSLQATANRLVRAAAQPQGGGVVERFRPYRCRNAALTTQGGGQAHRLRPVRWVRAGFTVQPGALVPAELAGAVQNIEIEPGLTLRDALRLVAAASAGKVSGAAGATVRLRAAVADHKERITATTDADGNRTAIAVDLS
jgi:hypothetical protein